jgi:DNA helicase HerA-like ATPase
MPSTDYINEAPYAGESQANPLEPLEHMLQWLTSTTVHLAIGFAIGLIVARVMRSRHLRWTWAATALGVVFAGHSILGGGLATTLGAAALCATVRGRRWHREDLDTGADLAEIAAQRRGPLDAVRSLWHKLRDDRRDAVASPRSSWRGGRLIVGEGQDHRPVTIPLGGSAGGTHTLVIGAAGSGKTVTMTWIATQTIAQAQGAIVVDPKGDPDLRESLRDAARAAGRRFVHWSPEGPSVYNPYARGSETEIADKVLAGERYSEPHYLRQAQRYLGHVVRALRKAEVEVSLQDIVDHLDPARLELLVRMLPEVDANKTYRYLDTLTKRQRSDLAGVRDRLAILAESDIGPWLDPRTEGAERFELIEAVRTGTVVYFDLESDRRPLLTQMLGAAIVQDLQTTVATLQGRPVPSLVAIDEFSAIAPEHVARLFARARAAGMSLVLGTQELSDLRLPGAERLLDQIMGNLSALIAHRQVLPASAELIASLTEMRGVWRTSRHDDGRHTRTRDQENTLRAEQIMSLGQGWAAVIDVLGGGRVSIARIRSRQRQHRTRRRHRR